MQIDLTRGDIRNHIKTVAVPASVGFLFHTLFNVTDTYFAGYLSTQALAALSLSFPIFFIIIALAGGMSEALTALIGNALGNGEKEQAQRIAQNSTLFALLLSLLLSFFGLLIAPAAMQLLGAQGDYLTLTLAYIDIIIYGTALFVATFFINAVLNALGDTVSFRNILMLSALLNVILDYWFVTGGLGVSPMGIEGIALSTVIIEALSAVYLFYRLSQTPFFKEMPPFQSDTVIFRELFSQGIAPSANMGLTAVGIAIITYFAAPFGEEVIAAFGIGMRVEQILLMPLIGLNVAVLTLVAQNNGAALFERINETLRHALRYALLLSLVGAVTLWLGGEYLMGYFSSDPRVVNEGVRYLYVEAFLIYPFALIFIYAAFLQGIKKPGFIFYLSLARQILLPVILLSLITSLFHNVLGIWIAIAAIVGISALIIRHHASGLSHNL